MSTIGSDDAGHQNKSDDSQPRYTASDRRTSIRLELEENYKLLKRKQGWGPLLHVTGRLAGEGPNWWRNGELDGLDEGTAGE